VIGVRTLLIVLERLMVRSVIPSRLHGIVPSKSGVMRSADRPSFLILAGLAEAALEPTPRDVLSIEKISNVLPRHSDQVAPTSFGLVAMQ
jgi:hypothetical protein